MSILSASAHSRPTVLRRLAALLLSASCLAGVAPGPASGDAATSSLRAGERPHRWSGYAIRGTGDAAGGWIGGYRVGPTTLYLVTPLKDRNRAGFDAPRAVDDLPGKAASRTDTERAAWILSKYGGYRDATQAAAVDATVYHLLAGGKWKIGSPRGASRIRQSGDPAAVRRFARIMLRQSAASAGAYVARLDAAGADVGGAVAVTLRVVDGHGRPAAGLPVTLAMAGGAPLAAVTGDDGRAVARFPASARGWQEVTATVRSVPDHQLHVWPAEKKGQAAAAEGGARRELVVSTLAAVRGPQTLSLAADPGQLIVGSSARVVATVAGDGSARAASAALYGPFATAGAAGCAGASVAQVSSTVTTDGAYAMSSLTPPGGGYYAWRVAVDGNDTNMPVATCGAVAKVRGKPVLGVTAPLNATTSEPVLVSVSISGLPFPMRADVNLKLYAAADTSCSSPIKQFSISRLGNGQLVSGSILLDTPGVYTWRAEVDPGELWVGAASTCGAAGSTTQVS